MGDNAAVSELRRRFFEDYRASIEQGRYLAEDVRRCRSSDWWMQAFCDRYDGDVDVALPAMIECLKWRHEFRVHALTPNTLADSLEKKIMYIHGEDKRECPLLWFNARYHKKDPYDMETRRILVYWLEKHFNETKADQQLVVVFDMTGTGLQHMDLDLIKFLLHCVKYYFPGILSYLLVYEIPWVLNAAWKVVKTWLDPNAQKKIIFVGSSGIHQYIDVSNLPLHMNGNDDYQFSLHELRRERSPLATSEDIDAQSLDSIPTDFGSDCGLSLDYCSPAESNGPTKRRTVTFADGNNAVTDSRIVDMKAPPIAGPMIPRSASGSMPSSSPSPAATTAVNSNVASSSSSSPHNPAPATSSPVQSFSPPSSTLSTSTKSKSASSSSISGSQKNTAHRCKELTDQRLNTVNNMISELPAYLLISPQDELVFVAQSEDQESVDVIGLRNGLPDQCLAYKIKTTSPEKFRVRPSSGFLRSGQTCVIKIYLQAGYHQTVYRDKFLVLGCIVPPNHDPDHMEPVPFWKGVSKADTLEYRLRCRYSGPSDTLSVASSEASPPSISVYSNGSIPTDHESIMVAKRLQELQSTLASVQDDVRILRLGLCFVFGLCLILLFSVKWTSASTIPNTS